jgi:signal transduction histidine kinase
VEVIEDQLLLRVRDTGQGIPEDEQSEIFNKFYRASNVAAQVQGTGLGLSIVKSVVDNHHGRIWVESTPGAGSTFSVVLPLRPTGNKPCRASTSSTPMEP